LLPDLSPQTIQSLPRYGNAAEKPSDEVLALQATEAYVEYDAAGRVIRGQEVKAKSRYEEDVHINNHTSVWGSWWHDGQWGYACCHSTVKQSYCVGAAGRDAATDAAEQLAANMEKKQAEVGPVLIFASCCFSYLRSDWVGAKQLAASMEMKQAEVSACCCTASCWLLREVFGSGWGLRLVEHATKPLI
jgi:hypothetical protein